MAAPTFEQVFNDHHRFAWRCLARQRVAEGDLPDLCQEVFLVVHRNLDGFAGRSSLRTWIYGICRNVASNHRRKAVHRREQPMDCPPEPPPDMAGDPAPHAEVCQRESLAILEEQLAALSAEQRDVFVLYEVEELTMREVAEALGCSQNTAYARLYAARERMRKALSQRAKWRVA